MTIFNILDKFSKRRIQIVWTGSKSGRNFHIILICRRSTPRFSPQRPIWYFKRLGNLNNATEEARRQRSIQRRKANGILNRGLWDQMYQRPTRIDNNIVKGRKPLLYLFERLSTAFEWTKKELTCP